MIIAKVVGAAVASLKLEALQASKLLIVRQTDAKGDANGPAFLAVDLVGAGEDELVIVSQGSTARVAIAQAERSSAERSPADAAIIGILDSLKYYGEQVFTK